MPTVREPLSLPDLCQRLGVEVWRLIDVEVNLNTETAALVLQGPDRRPEDNHRPYGVTRA